MLDKLQSLKREIRVILDEQHALDTKEREAKDILKNCASQGSLDDPKVQRLVGNARTTLDLVASRRGYVEDALTETAARIRVEFRAADKIWTKIIQKREEDLWARIHEANLPFFQGDKDSVKLIESITFPILTENRRAHTPDLPAVNERTAPADMPDLVSSFISHIRSHAKRLSIPIGESL